MPLAPEEKPGRSFATDMRLIREQRGLSPQDIYRATKLPIEIVTLFEQTGLVNHPRYNRVYLRSFVREYARVVGIRENDALEGLEAALGGHYRGTLALTYLGLERGDLGGDAPPEAWPGQERSDAPVAVPIPTSESRYPKAAAHERESSRKVAERREAHIGEGRERRHSGPRISTGRLSGMIAALVLFAAAVASVVYLLMAPGSPKGPVRTEEAISLPPVDSASEVGSLPSAPVIGDTMRVSVIASGGKLEPIRRQIDNSLVDVPHWVEEGDTLHFSAVTGFSLSGALSRIALLVDGHPMPTDQRNAEGRLVFSREDVIRHLEAAHDSTR